MLGPKRVVVDLPTRTVVNVLLLVIAAYASWRLVAAVANVLILIGLAAFLAVMLGPLVQIAERRMPRGVAVIVVWLGTFLTVFGFLVLLFVPLARQVDDLAAATPTYIHDLQSDSRFRELNDRFHLLDKAQQHAGSVPSTVFGAAGHVAVVVGDGITVLFLSLFLLFELPNMASGVLSLLPPGRAQQARRIGLDVQRNVAGYVAGNLLISLVAGLTTFITLEILGVPFAIALALILALFDLVPLIGATIGAVVVVGVTLATTGTFEAIVVVIVQVIYQQVENHLLQPIVYRRTVQLSAFVVMVAVLMGAALLGVLGALLAIPIAGSIQLLVREILAERRAGMQAAAPPAPPEPSPAA
jgi:predicted PurR-regulated permease PerM